MSIVPGKFYKTREGKKAFVVEVGNPFLSAQATGSNACIGWVEPNTVCMWDIDGKFFGSVESNKDLIDECD